MRLIPGGKDDDRPISKGEDFQCDCTANSASCPCTRWGKWVAAGRPVPSEVRCDKCQRGDHSG